MLHTDLLSAREKKINGEIILPDYGGFCLSEIPRLVETLFGVRKEGGRPLISWCMRHIHSAPQVVILFLFDGFGFRQWQSPSHRFSLLEQLSERGAVTPIHAAFPPTTAASLTSLHTGLTPAAHGLLEWHAFMPSLGLVIKPLVFSPIDDEKTDSLTAYGVSPTVLFQGETIYERLHRSGISSYALVPSSFMHGAYSSVAYNGAHLIGYKHASDLAVNLRDAVEGVDRPAYFFVYWDGVDAMSHKYGPSSDQCFAEINSVTYILEAEFFRRLQKRSAHNAVCMMTADHGAVGVESDRTVYLNDFLPVVENFGVGRNGRQIPPWGSPRAVFLKIREEAQDKVQHFLRNTLKDNAIIMRSRDVLEHGLFGKGIAHPELEERVGDLIIFPKENHTVWYQYPNKKKSKKRGMHGGISKDELTVPFLIGNLSEFCF